MVVKTRRKYNGGRYTRKMNGGSGRGGNKRKKDLREYIPSDISPYKRRAQMFTPAAVSAAALATKPADAAETAASDDAHHGAASARKAPVRQPRRQASAPAELGIEIDKNTKMNVGKFYLKLEQRAKNKIDALTKKIAQIDASKTQVTNDTKFKIAIIRALVGYLVYMSITNVDDIIDFLNALLKSGVDLFNFARTAPSVYTGFAKVGDIISHTTAILNDPNMLLSALLAYGVIQNPFNLDLHNTIARNRRNIMSLGEVLGNNITAALRRVRNVRAVAPTLVHELAQSPFSSATAAADIGARVIPFTRGTLKNVDDAQNVIDQALRNETRVTIRKIKEESRAKEAQKKRTTIQHGILDGKGQRMVNIGDAMATNPEAADLFKGAATNAELRRRIILGKAPIQSRSASSPGYFAGNGTPGSAAAAAAAAAAGRGEKKKKKKLI